MSKIYTKTGDKGKTSLFDGTRVDKDHIRIETYGTIDELNSTLGVVRAYATKHKALQDMLGVIQKDLFDIGAKLANPLGVFEDAFAMYLNERILSFEKAIDEMTEKLPVLANFILPGGGMTGSHLHVARTITRRVEREIIRLAKIESVDYAIIRYFNRLSDLLYTMSRFANHQEGIQDTLWTKFIG